MQSIGEIPHFRALFYAVLKSICRVSDRSFQNHHHSGRKVEGWMAWQLCSMSIIMITRLLLAVFPEFIFSQDLYIVYIEEDEREVRAPQKYVSIQL